MTLHLVLTISLVIGALSIAAALAEITGTTEAMRLMWMLWRDQRAHGREDAIETASRPRVAWFGERVRP
jgi:hypothetical protein